MFFLFCLQFVSAQKWNLHIQGIDSDQHQIIDSIMYNKKHQTLALLMAEKKVFENKLLQNGYFESKLVHEKKINDSIFSFTYNLNKQTKIILIDVTLNDDERKLLNLEEKKLRLRPNQVSSFLEQGVSTLEKKGYALAQLQLTHFISDGTLLKASLKLELNQKRVLNKIIIEGYDGFPKGIKKAILKKFKQQEFNQNNVAKIYKDFNALRFVVQKKYPEILFKTDTTQVFVYLEKGKPNKFDGFVGFTNNNQNKLRFNGYLDLQLLNILNSGEQLNLIWKNDGAQQSSFNIGTEIPYLFKSPIGIKADLRIFKQDSTFQNTKTDFNLGYYLKYNSKLFLGYQSTSSVDIQKNMTLNVTDFNSAFITTSYDYNYFKSNETLFSEQSLVQLKIGTGNRTNETSKTRQFFGQIIFSHHINLNNKNSIYIKNESFYLQSNSYLANELYRFGGINSIRGFNENSLQANAYSGIITEYRYKMASNIYLKSIIDYAYVQDKTTNTNNRLLGLGFGFGLLSKSGLFHFIYANGSQNQQSIKLSNTLVHVSFKAYF